MQNISTSSYINKKNIINIKSEILYREAEDDFYYFNKINNACKKLSQAINLTPFHLKSIILLADIYFIKGQIRKSLKLYLQADSIRPDYYRILAGIANCLNKLKNYKTSLDFCNSALKYLKNDKNDLLIQILEIKLDNLIQLKYYNNASFTINQINNIINKEFLSTIYNDSYILLSEKLKLQKKLEKSKLKIIQL